GEEMLLLGADQIRAVDREQRVALLHRLAGVVDKHVLDVAADLEDDLGKFSLVVVEAPHGVDDLLDGLSLGDPIGEANHLPLRLIEVDGRLGKACGLRLRGRHACRLGERPRSRDAQEYEDQCQLCSPGIACGGHQSTFPLAGGMVVPTARSRWASAFSQYAGDCMCCTW